MNINDIIVQMKNDVSLLSSGEVAIGGLAVTVLSMVIVFAVLTMLMYMIKIMTKILVKTEKEVEEVSNATNSVLEASVGNTEEIAAIMAAISAISGVGENKLVIRNIKVCGENNWSLQSRLSQIGNRI